MPQDGAPPITGSTRLGAALYIVGAWITTLVAIRATASLPAKLDLAGLAAISVAAFLWALRINRVAAL